MVKCELNALLSTKDTSNDFEAENKDLRKQISHYKGIEEKNKLLAFELDEKEIIIDSYSTESEEMTKSYENLKNELDEKSRHIHKLTQDLKESTNSSVDSINLLADADAI